MGSKSLCGVLLVWTVFWLSSPLDAQTGQVIFNDTFESSSGTPTGWISALDGSVTCSPPYATTADDVDAYVDPGSSWPGHGRVFVIHANTNSEPATFANSIGYREFPYAGGGNYKVEMDLRMWRTDGIYKNQYYGMNLTFNENYTDYFAEVNIEANPSSPDFGYLMYRQGNAPPWTRHRIAYVGSNPKVWRHLIVNVWVDSVLDTYILESVNINGVYYVLHKPLATRATPWTNSFGLLLESNALYTGCTPVNTFVGIAVFDNVKVTYFPWS